MLSINCKIELKHKWTKYCVLYANGDGNGNDNSIKLFLLSKTKNYMFRLEL